MMVADIAMVVAQVLLAAAMGESLCEFLFMPLIDLLTMKLHEEARAMIKRGWSAGIGIAIALNYTLDLFGLINMRGQWGWFGVVLTGTLIGRGSNAVHSFVEKWIANAAAKKAEAIMAVRSARAFKEYN